jgi:hypothetical protein
MTALPTWLLEHLNDIGALNADGVSRRARHTACHTCGHRVLRGLDFEPCGAMVECDAHEIDTNGELLALALGLRTYTLTRAATSTGKPGWNLDPRNQWAIAAGQRTPLVAQHRCGIAIPATAHPRLPARVRTAQTDEPVF